jgi:hypothetical protein
MYITHTTSVPSVKSTVLAPIVHNATKNFQSQLSAVDWKQVKPYTLKNLETGKQGIEMLISQETIEQKPEIPVTSSTDISTGPAITVVIIVLMAYLSFLDKYRKD